MNVTSLVRVALALAAIAISTGVTRADPPPSLQELLASCQANWQGVQDLEVVYESASTGPVDGLVPLTETTFRWAPTRFYGCMIRPGGLPKQISFDYEAPEGRVRYPASNSRGTNLYDAGAASWMANQLRPPDPVGSTAWHWTFDLEGILQHDETTVRPETDVIDGRVAAVVDAHESGVPALTVWLDIERSAVPLKWVRYGGDGQPFTSAELSDYLHVDGLAWLPLHIVYSWMSGSMSGVVTSQSVLPDDAGAPQIKLNSGLGPEDLIVHFPNNTIIFDQDTGQLTQLVASAAPAELSRALADAVEKHQCTRGRVPVQARASFRVTGTMAAVLSISLLAFGAALRLWRS